jgi:serine-type D-Ala-D-Ala carboxypeptidase/endopeptidase (penicillin-binding protein 4)
MSFLFHSIKRWRVAAALLFSLNFLEAAKPLPEQITKIMKLEKYKHANWGLYVKDANTEEVLFDLNSEQMFLPASTTKLFSIAALLNFYGEDYQFKTPIYAVGAIKEGILEGNLILVAQGDLVMGGRMQSGNKIAFTKLDHIVGNSVPGVVLTKEDPLYGMNELAKEIKRKGIKEIHGNVLIDDRLFEITKKREIWLSPIMINENLIDILINPSEIGKAATLTWRPKLEGYDVVNEVITSKNNDSSEIEVSSDPVGKKIVVKGKITLDQQNLVRTFSINDPNHFARSALIQALRNQGIVVYLKTEKEPALPEKNFFRDLQPIATFTSPPLSEYIKLILKVSHNLGADLVAPLLAVREGKTSFSEGMQVLGKFITEKVQISKNSFIFLDAAGGDENRLTPKAEIQLLDYMRNQPKKRFEAFFNSLPIMGVDGSLADFGKNSAAVGKIHAKTGTGINFNLATNEFFLTTQALAGYIEAKNGHLLEFILVVNNGTMPKIEDIFPIFEDLSQISSIIYEQQEAPSLSQQEP